jgi:hypothetical protein
MRNSVSLPVLLRLSFIAAPLIATLLTAAGTLLPETRRATLQVVDSETGELLSGVDQLDTSYGNRPPSAVRRPPSAIRRLSAPACRKIWKFRTGRVCLVEQSSNSPQPR